MARAILVLAMLALTLAGCASDDPDTQSTSETSSTTGDGTTVSVSGSVSISNTSSTAPSGTALAIEDDRFAGGNVTINVGETVAWTNQGQNPHSVASDIGLFDSSPGCTATTPDACMKNGETFSHRFDAPGTYAYHCSVHPTTMSGTVTVVQE